MLTRLIGSVPINKTNPSFSIKSVRISSKNTLSGSIPCISVATVSPIGMSSSIDSSLFSGNNTNNNAPPPLFPSSSSSETTSSFTSTPIISNVPATIIGAGLSSFFLAVLSIFLDPKR
eukprot:TRINITY_DN1711_c0_g1_i1.p1 TRINITY_DN1711_c0_g1~~TRINITY_DN1711_c0_g1_i1.p1  ORF type:complete len:118 (+),score=21.36 TRINITY_DN1711_c0_g1_i1:218-571(+)